MFNSGHLIWLEQRRKDTEALSHIAHFPPHRSQLALLWTMTTNHRLLTLLEHFINPKESELETVAGSWQVRPWTNKKHPSVTTVLDMCPTGRQDAVAKIAVWKERDLEGFFSKMFLNTCFRFSLNKKFGHVKVCHCQGKPTQSKGPLMVDEQICIYIGHREAGVGEDSYTEIKNALKDENKFILPLNREEWISFLETSTMAFFFLFYGKNWAPADQLLSFEERRETTAWRSRSWSGQRPGPRAPPQQGRGDAVLLLNSIQAGGPDSILARLCFSRLLFNSKPWAQECAFLSWLWATFLGFDKCGRCQQIPPPPQKTPHIPQSRKRKQGELWLRSSHGMLRGLNSF